MQFHQLTLDQINQVRHMYPYVESRTCDYTVGGMFMWRNYYHMEYALEEGAFYTRLSEDGSRFCYSLPMARDIKAAVRHIIEEQIPEADIKNSAFGQMNTTADRYLCFSTIPEAYLPMFIELADELPIRLVTGEQTEYFDYLYRAEDLVNLTGRRYSGQRNQIKHFEAACPDWRFVPLTSDSITDIMEFFGINTDITNEHNTRNEENTMVLEVLENMDHYGMVGGILYAGDEIAGFSMGEIKGDTLYTHIEKADRNYKGSYQMLTNQFAVYYAANGIEYINREEDMGNPGLRRAKEAWHPVELLKKYVVEVLPYAD